MAQNGNTQWGQVLLFVIHYFFYLVTIKLAEMEVRAVTHFGAKTSQHEPCRLRAQNELQKSIERVMEVPSCAALRWSIQHMITKKASTKLASIYLILDEIKATQPTVG